MTVARQNGKGLAWHINRGEIRVPLARRVVDVARVLGSAVAVLGPGLTALGVGYNICSHMLRDM